MGNPFYGQSRLERQVQVSSILTNHRVISLTQHSFGLLVLAQRPSIKHCLIVSKVRDITLGTAASFLGCYKSHKTTQTFITCIALSYIP